MAEIDRVVNVEHLEATLMSEGVKKFSDPQKALLRARSPRKRKAVAEARCGLTGLVKFVVPLTAAYEIGCAVVVLSSPSGTGDLASASSTLHWQGCQCHHV